MILKKSIRSAISAFLLLCFASAVFPLDFLHHHTTHNSCSELAKHSTCHHKLHLTKKAASCFACTAHIDQSFILSQIHKDSYCPSAHILIFDKEVAAYSVKTPLTFLRGPPVHPFS